VSLIENIVENVRGREILKPYQVGTPKPPEGKEYTVYQVSLTVLQPGARTTVLDYRQGQDVYYMAGLFLGEDLKVSMYFKNNQKPLEFFYSDLVNYNFKHQFKIPLIVNRFPVLDSRTTMYAWNVAFNPEPNIPIYDVLKVDITNITPYDVWYQFYSIYVS